MAVGALKHMQIVLQDAPIPPETPRPQTIQ